MHAPAFTGMQCEVKWGVRFRIGAFLGLVFIVVGCFGDWMWGWEAQCCILNSWIRVVKQCMLSATIRKEEATGPKRWA